MSQAATRDYAQLMKEALVELQQLRAENDDLKRAQSEPIAIVGMGCRFPGGVIDPEGFWELLRQGRDTIGEVPADRWDASSYYDPDPDAPGKIATRFGGFLDGIDQFDAGFFGISPREAHTLDPQQRLLLEVSWEALESAGQSATALYGQPAGVFIGMSTFDYALHQVGGHLAAGDRDRIDGYVATGTTLSPAAGRLSYVLGFTGPSMVVDTACSSSLVAAHLAITSLRQRECRLALVGGVNLILRPEWNINFSKARMLAPDGRCKTFDAAANGYVRGEGCAVLVLERLSEALAARRNIVAVIRGSAVNQDGASGGLTVPNGPAQEQVIRRALESARVSPQDIGYIEAHGTGTSLGDPIEMAALGTVVAPGRTKHTPLMVGSVKTNIGHLEAAAGVAGLMKAALAVRHGEIPPHLHFRHGNPMIDWESLSVAIPVAPIAWPGSGTPRRAGVSSFGFTGTNAHIIVEEPPSQALAAPAVAAGTVAERPHHVLTISARSEAALQQLVGRYVRHLGEQRDLSLADVAFTANAGRAHFRHRLAVVAASTSDAQEKLAAYGGGELPAGVFRGAGSERPNVAFLFSGQGSQYADMGRELYATQPVFRRAVDRCQQILASRLDVPLVQLLFAPAGAPSLLDQTQYTQPALFAFEYALAELWRSWGVQPTAVMGHSVGEYVAACVAGVFSLDDALALIAERARLMQRVPEAGQMVAVQTSAEQARSIIAPHGSTISLAALNGPTSVVISGGARAMAGAVAAFTTAGIATQLLRVSHAFHSPLMEPMLAEFEQAARRIAFASPTIPIVSNLTGEYLKAEMATPEYWVSHVREAVRFADGMHTLYNGGCRTFLEIGPASTLSAMASACIGDPTAAWLPSLRRGAEWHQLLYTLAELYARGVQVEWTAFDREYARRPVTLPTYPFQRKRYWVEIAHDDRVERRPAGTRSVAPQQSEAPAEGEPAVDDLLYQVEWCWRPRAADEQVQAPAGHWTVLHDGGPLAGALAKSLENKGAHCSLVSDIDQLRAALSSNGARGIVSLCGLDAPSTEDLISAQLDRPAAIENLLELIRTLANTRMHQPPLVWCVTRGAVPIESASGEQAVALTQALQWGFGRNIALEHPELWGGLVDLDPDGAVETAAEALAIELLLPDGEDQIALRGDARYVPRLARASAGAAADVTIDAEGTYLVTGGAGALGRQAARWLVANGARTVVLASRRGLTTPGAADAVRELEGMGTRVQVMGVDIASESDVDRLLADIAAGPNPLRGIIHAAGVDEPAAIADMTPRHLQSVLGAKARGAWLLHAKTLDLPLEFFLCFSSVAALWGAPRRAHYAAANAFLDALAHARRRGGRAALSVNWGAWREGGMGSNQELRQLEESGHRPLASTVAFGALDAVIARSDVQSVVADIDWPRYRRTLEARRRRPLFAELPDALPAEQPQPAREHGDWLARLRAVPEAQRASMLEDLLRAEVAATLGFNDASDVPTDQSVFDLGMDSLRAVQLALRLQQHLGLEHSSKFFGHSQVRTLAARLLDEIELPGQSVGQPATLVRDPDGLTGYAPEREREILEFSRIAWPYRPDHCVESRWHWMFVESAERLGLEPRVWLYREAGKVVAHHGAIRVGLKVGAEVFDAAWFVDTMVLKNHRSSAIGARLLIAGNDEFDVGLSLGQTQEMRKISFQLGSEQVAPLRTFVLVLRSRHVLKDKLNPVMTELARVGLSGRQYLKRLLSRPNEEGLEVRPVDVFDSRHDRLWESVATEYECAVIRDSSYLNWKYVAQPGQDFVRLEFVKAGELIAVAVLAISDPGSIFRYRRAFIVDLVVLPSRSRRVLGVLEGIRQYCVRLDVDAIVFHLINDQLEKSARAYGFAQRATTRFLLVHPLRPSGETRARLLRPTNWLITMGDSDIDRPWEADGDRVQVRSVSAPSKHREGAHA